MWWRKPKQQGGSGPVGRPASEASARSPRLRHSEALRYFLECLGARPGLTIVDFGAVSQANISAITSLGHRIYAEDLLRSVAQVTHPEDPPGGPMDARRVGAIVDNALPFEDGTVHGVLAWDVLQFVSVPLLESLLRRLVGVLVPGAPLLAYFDAAGKPGRVTVWSFQIVDRSTLRLTPRAERELVSVFNTRAIERLFSSFRSVKFFLSAGEFREVVVTR